MGILAASGLKKYYGKEPNIVRALDGVDIDVSEGEFVAVAGTSGSGKSTLLHMLGGLDRPDSGTVSIGRRELLKMSDDELTVFRRRNIGFVFQSYNLVPILSVYENIVFPIELDGNAPDKSFVGKIIEMLGISGKTNAMPNQLSGGQQQRAAIARALASKPSVILADEPTGNLDSRTSKDVLEAFKLTAAEFNQTIMIITHNEQITKIADRVIYIEDGKIKSGAVSEP
jgi:putative ABC transport system ATP-binding protein